MSKKILIIGQAPPLKNQTVPYDTTLLYTMLEWIGITKEQAQEIFTFESISVEFPGHTKSGAHKAPLRSHVKAHEDALSKEIEKCDKVILLGNSAINVFFKDADFFQITVSQYPPNYLLLPHPSRRNYSLIMKNKTKITSLLSDFLIPLSPPNQLP